MVTIRNANEIIASLIDFFRLVQPNLDTKPGTVARDLFVDAPASQLSLLYDELSGVSDKQSLRIVTGTDLDKLAKNFGISRKQSTPSIGVALLTFSSINATININQGTIVTANNGLSFSVTVGVSVSPQNNNFYRSLATKFSAQLAYAGITDQYAVQVTCAATSPGAQGNIGQYSLNSTTVTGVSNVTNVNSFQGGTDQETDAAFRNRVLSSFSGSSVGTALGYLNTALGTTGVLDAAIIEPGDPLMIRDGTVTKTINGVLTIVQEGSGGKVDVVVLGTTDVQNSDTFVYQDKSNSNDPTSSKNNFVLGQIAADANKTVSRKRIDDIKNAQLPSQPVDGILQVTGSGSGSNFVPKTIDTYGRVSGNYQLVKDTGVYGGSPFGFDTFVWIDNKISDFQEDRVKGQPYGQDPTTFTGVLEISDVQQNLPITNENSTVTTDRSIIQLLHAPANNVTRVFNVNTGERYVITNQNVDATSPFNSTGRIQISGNTLPSPSDVLQVDYTWIVDYDQFSDFDGLYQTTNQRPVTDSIDWGYASLIRNEIVPFTLSPGNNYYQGTTSHPVSTIISANTFLRVDGYVQQVTSGAFVNRLSVVVSNLATAPTSVDSITFKNSNVEIYNTAQANGSFTTTTAVVGINVLFIATIILPIDTVANINDPATVYLNNTNVFQSSSAQGSSNGTQVTIPSSLIDITTDTINLKVVYIANVTDLYSAATVSLPTSRVGNGYLNGNNNGFTNFSIVNTSRRENQVVQLNLSNQYFVELNLTFADYTLLAPDVLSVIRLSDGYQLWTTDNPGTVFNAADGNYQLILPGYGNPQSADRVLVVYSADDIRRFQPFSFNNTVIKTRLDKLGQDALIKKFVVPLNSFAAQASGLSFTVQDRDSDNVYFTVTDGYLTTNTDGSANINSLSEIFSSLPDLTNKVVRITKALNVNNNGLYDITAYNINNNNITIANTLRKISPDQISVIRVLDGQELWNYSGTIDVANNRIILPPTQNAVLNDLIYVMFFNFNNLRKAPTRLSSVTLDQIINPGVITVNGTSLAKADSVIFTATSTGLKQNLQEAMRKTLGLSSTAPIPTNVRIAKIISLKKVSTYSPTNDIVLETLTTFDVKSTLIANNLYFADEMLSNPLFSGLDFQLPNTINNSLTGATNNVPTLGDKLEVTFYYVTDNDSENLSYTRNGTLYTNKKFALINKIYASSGFKASQGTKFTATSFTQPSLGFRYKGFYDYTAPKQNERIVISYNYNKLISDVTFNIEATRPINADVLVRAGKLVLLDLTMNVVISSTYQTTSTTVLQNLRNQLVSALTTTTLGAEVDQATLINVAQAVPGIARARILHFNVANTNGQVLTVQANEDQYFQPNNIIINTETR